MPKPFDFGRISYPVQMFICEIRKNEYPTHSDGCQYRRQDEQPATSRHCNAQAWHTEGQ